MTKKHNKNDNKHKVTKDVAGRGEGAYGVFCRSGGGHEFEVTPLHRVDNTWWSQR